MGNRAVITTAPYSSSNLGIYLHWNGGRASIEGFTAAAKELGISLQDDYGHARFTQMIANFFGGLHSVGIAQCIDLDEDNGDNGVYVLDPKTLEITGRMYFEGSEEKDPEKTIGLKNDVLEINRPIFKRKD